MPHDTRDAVLDYVRHWSCRAELPAKKLLAWLGLRAGKFHHWQKRYGQPQHHLVRVLWVHSNTSIHRSILVGSRQIAGKPNRNIGVELFR